MSGVNVSRRHFLRSSAVVGGGVVVGFSLTGCSSPDLPIDALGDSIVPNAFLQLTSDNNCRFYCPRDEMGQGVTTGLGTLIGEELDLDPASLDIVFAGAHSDYANPEFGVQGTGGSTSLRAHYKQLRQVAANTRALLVDAAAQDLGVAKAQLSTKEGAVIADGRAHPYGQFVATARTLALPEAAPLKDVADFRYIGKEFPRVDALAKSTGTADYGIDIDIPGMHHAVVKRSPVAGAKLVSVDKTAAENMPGVVQVLEISSGVAVVAEKYWQAKTAADKLSIEWEDAPLASVSSADVLDDYRAAMAEQEGDSEAEQGDVESALANASAVIENEYWAPYLAHAPMEPMNAVLKIENGSAEIWTGSQGSGAVQGLVSRFSGIDTENIRVHNTYLGGGFGRRATLTHVIEVTEIAVATGKPIHLLWSREDDIRNGIYRPASLMTIKAGVDDEGNIAAWRAKRVGGNITPDTLKNMMPALLPGVGDGPINFMTGLADSVFDGWVVDHSSIEGLYEDYDFPNREVLHVTHNHGLPVTFLRSVGHSYTAFAKETMVDELAQQAGIDAVEFRLRNTQSNPRLNNVIKVAGERMREMDVVEGRHLGFAAHGSFMTDVAEIAEVSVENGAIKVHKVTCVVDCGVTVNPDIVRAQMEGAVMYGLTAALHGNIGLKNGAVQESNFHDYPILRMNEAPAVEVVIIDSGTEPTGVGEPGLPPIAPAVANAVFAATGQRLRSLPLRLA